MADLTVAIHDDESSSVSVELSDPEIPVFIGYDQTDQIPGPTGPEGKRVQLRNNGTAIQWKYFDDTVWTDLVQNVDLIPTGSGVTLPINISDVTGLDDALNGKAPSVHSHTIAEIASLSIVLSTIQTAISNLQAADAAYSIQISNNTSAINAEVVNRSNAINSLQSYISGVQSSLITDINALWTHMNAIEAFRDSIDANSDGVVDDSERLGGEVAANYALKSYVDSAINAIVNGSPALLDTLNELATALGNDPNFATSMASALAGKEGSITAGTISQFWRGDKSWQTLTQADISGLTSALSALSAAITAKEASITAPADATKFWDGTKTFRALTQADISGLVAALAAKEASITAPADASKFWDGTKAFRALTQSDIPGLTASIANRKSFLYYKRTGLWYNNSITALALTTFALTANNAQAYMSFLIIEETVTITDIAVEITTAGSASSLMHFGLYQVTNPLLAYNSGPLVASTTTGVAASTTGVKSLTLPTPVTLSPGVYLCACSTDSTTAVTMRTIAAGSSYSVAGSTAASALVAIGFTGTRASFAALPSNLSSFTAVNQALTTPPLAFWFKIQ